MSEGPFTTAFNSDLTGVVRREIITYRYVNGTLVKETAGRDYSKNDYHDFSERKPMPEIK